MTTNRYEATCTRCGLSVTPGDGIVTDKQGEKWLVVHESCVPSISTTGDPVLQQILHRKVIVLIQEIARCQPKEKAIFLAVSETQLLRDLLAPSKLEFDL